MLGRPENDGAALMERLHELLLAELALGCEPMPGARELLDALRAHGTPIAMCSNSPRVVVEAALLGARLDGTFAAVVAGDDGHAPKPAPDAYLTAAAALGAEPARCIALEDSPTGARSAQAAGMYVIGVPSVPGVSLDGFCEEQHAFARRAGAVGAARARRAGRLEELRRRRVGGDRPRVAAPEEPVGDAARAGSAASRRTAGRRASRRPHRRPRRRRSRACR